MRHSPVFVRILPVLPVTLLAPSDSRQPRPAIGEHRPVKRPNDGSLIVASYIAFSSDTNHLSTDRNSCQWLVNQYHDNVAYIRQYNRKASTF
jgi:hypothetical protein